MFLYYVCIYRRFRSITVCIFCYILLCFALLFHKISERTNRTTDFVVDLLIFNKIPFHLFIVVVIVTFILFSLFLCCCYCAYSIINFLLFVVSKNNKNQSRTVFILKGNKNWDFFLFKWWQKTSERTLTHNNYTKTVWTVIKPYVNSTIKRLT